MTTRVCSTCKVEKSFDEFNKDSRKKHGIRYNCKECERVRMKKYDTSDSGQKRMRVGRWKQQGIDITHEEYVDRYTRLQGKCQICNKSFKTLCVDHNHSTGKIRGLLCRPCNIAISALMEDKDIMQNAIKYIEDTK